MGWFITNTICIYIMLSIKGLWWLKINSLYLDLSIKYLKPAEQFSEFFKGYKFQWISIILDLDRDSRHLNDLILIFWYRLYYKLENIVLFVFVLFCFCLCFFFWGVGGCKWNVFLILWGVLKEKRSKWNKSHPYQPKHFIHKFTNTPEIYLCVVMDMLSW